MTTATLRKCGNAIAVSLPKKLIATLGLRAGSMVEVEVELERNCIVLVPARRRHTLAQIEKEQRALDHAASRTHADREWIDAAACGREQTT